MKAVFDTNILIDFLKKENSARQELGHYGHKIISIITYMEILVGAKAKDDELKLRGFLAVFNQQSITREIADIAVKLRQKHKIRLPDAVIWATALHHECLLITRNEKDFDKSHPSIRIPYKLKE